MDSRFKAILQSPVLKNLLGVFGKKPFQVVERSGSFVLRLEDEPCDEIARIIVLKPHGSSFNSSNNLDCYPGVREATVEVKGLAREGRHGSVLAKNCLAFVYYPDKNAVTIAGGLYAKDDKALRSVKNARTKFKAVKRGGYGFYHNLVNLTNEWLVLVLKEKTDQTKSVDCALLDRLAAREKKVLTAFLDSVVKQGDEIFAKDAELVSEVLSLPPSKSLPALISFLNVAEGAKHEQCTVFAVILKASRKDPALALKLLKTALKNKTAQEYYLKELIAKIK